MGNREIKDILSEQADRLIQGQREPIELADWNREQLGPLVPLMRLAERTQQALAPVEPNPAFVSRLGKQLIATTSASRKAVTQRTRQSILIVAAALGSVVSLVSAAGIIIYLIRHRGRQAPLRT